MDTPTTSGIGALVAAGLSAAGTVYVKITNQGQRISVLESQREDDMKKLDHIQVQVDRLVDWAMDKRYDGSRNDNR